MQTNALPRVRELDFLKGILILLVIAFHLVYFSTLYPYAKQVVYTFHMPAFLLLSGYLMNFEKGTRGVLRTLLWLVVPYVVMESSYIIMASILPIREHIETLTLGVFIDKLLLHPIGPYLDIVLSSDHFTSTPKSDNASIVRSMYDLLSIGGMILILLSPSSIGSAKSRPLIN